MSRPRHRRCWRRPGRSTSSPSLSIATICSRCSTARSKERADVELTAIQQDALIELLNIGFGRAAASLSQLTGHRVLLEVPQVSVHPISELRKSLQVIVSPNVASVHQIFSGPVAGDALLMLDQSGAA